jgi:hypothetical protein
MVLAAVSSAIRRTFTALRSSGPLDGSPTLIGYVMEQMHMEGTPVRAITSIVIPAEEVMFSVYEGPSAAADGPSAQRLCRYPGRRIVEPLPVAADQASELGNQATLRNHDSAWSLGSAIRRQPRS